MDNGFDGGKVLSVLSVLDLLGTESPNDCVRGNWKWKPVDRRLTH